MTVFFQFILIIIIIIPIIFILFAVFFLKRILGIARNLKKQTSDRYRTGGHGYGRWDSHSNDEVVIDGRTKGEATRKIFDKDEGEYVDFEEEK